MFVLCTTVPASAQNVASLGELQAIGSVKIESSTGQWQPSMPTYPLLGRTGIRTEDGIAALLFRDSSRADLAKQSLAVVTGMPSAYTVNLAKGCLSFNILPPAELTLITPSGTVHVNSAPGKTAPEAKNNVLGAVAVLEQGIRVKSMSGQMLISHAGSIKVIESGDALFFGSDGSKQSFQLSAFDTLGGVCDEMLMGAPVYTGYMPYVITGLSITSAIIIHNASPWGFEIW